MSELRLTDSLNEIRGIPPRFITKLAGMGIVTVSDLLFHLPARYEDFSQVYVIADLIPNQEATITARVVSIASRRTWHRSLFLVEAVLQDETGEIRATWFNQPYIKNVLVPGRLANFAGKVTVSKKDGDIYLSNPTYELTSEHATHADMKHTARIVPVYPETRGLTSKGFRYLIAPLLSALPRLDDAIPENILHTEGLPDINDALHAVHFPETIEEALAAKRRFAFENLLYLQLENARERARRARERTHAIPENIPEMKRLITTLPFELLLSQKKALWEVMQDMARPHPMHRLLQGDVGSGKTVVAALAAIHAAHAGFQAAFMAPTEILARQHYRTLAKFFGSFQGGVALMTGNESRMFYGHGLESEVKKPALRRDIAAGKIALVVGTHTLIEKSAAFDRLALVVVDEQHRFGVHQRATLAKKGPSASPRSTLVPHFLSMSATPIPRTLSLTVFGDLDLSMITELPKGRKPIITKIVPPTERTGAYAFIRAEIKKGRQAFVICPRIELTTNDQQPTTETLRKIEIKNVTDEYEKLSKKIFPDLRVAMLHGKMPAKGGKTTKESVMRNFAEGKTDILVATSVVEVGVDVPNASIMMIEGAERFGLAQLYQFRGRVGRGAHQSYCLLFTDATGETTKRRLTAVVKARNGFELAEADLKLRGPGEFLGTSQTGMPDIAMQALQHPELVKGAREAAQNLLEKDPNLTHHPELRTRLADFHARVHGE